MSLSYDTVLCRDNFASIQQCQMVIFGILDSFCFSNIIIQVIKGHREFDKRWNERHKRKW